jgi:hypothetical protein
VPQNEPYYRVFRNSSPRLVQFAMRVQFPKQDFAFADRLSAYISVYVWLNTCPKCFSLMTLDSRPNSSTARDKLKRLAAESSGQS